MSRIRWTWVFALILAWHTAQALYFALRIRHGTPSDELLHSRMSLLWPDMGGIFFRDSAATYALGPIGRFPPAFYVLSGSVAWVAQRLGSDAFVTCGSSAS